MILAKRKVLILCITATVLLIFIWKFIFENRETPDPYTACNMTASYTKQLEELFERVHVVLDHHSLVHFLCYGSLWGQIRMARLFPWSRKAEFCLFNDEVAVIDEAFLIKSFLKNKLQLSYNSKEGYYTVTDTVTTNRPLVELYVFEKDKLQSVFKRIGWKRRLLPPHCDWTPSLDCFPTFLIQQPLPQRKLGQFVYAVAMGGIELQKYLYPENWWREVRPTKCDQTKADGL